MNVFISADDKFILPAKVMLTSFLVNNPQEFHHVYFLHSGVRDENIEALCTLVGSYEAELIPVQIRESDFHGFKHTEQFPLLVYFRLLVCRCLPQTEDRALWLDVDLIVNGSLQEFYHQDFAGNAIVACRDISAQDRPVLLGHPAGTAYINAGVMLYNAAILRRYSLEDYYAYYLAHEDVILWQDQDIINGMFGRQIKVLDNRVYNVQIRWSFRARLCSLGYLRKQAKIIHYIGKEKPWHPQYFLRAAALWDHYYLKTCNKGWLYGTGYRMAQSCRRALIAVFIHPLRVLYKKLKGKQATA